MYSFWHLNPGFSLSLWYMTSSAIHGVSASWYAWGKFGVSGFLLNRKNCGQTIKTSPQGSTLKNFISADVSRQRFCHGSVSIHRKETQRSWEHWELKILDSFAWGFTISEHNFCLSLTSKRRTALLFLAPPDWDEASNGIKSWFETLFFLSDLSSECLRGTRGFTRGGGSLSLYSIIPLILVREH